MGARVRRSQARRLYPSVDLSRRDGCVAKELLDGPQVGSSFEQMGGERVAQRMGIQAVERRHVGRPPPRPGSQPASDVGCAQATPRLGQKQRAATVDVENGPGPGQVALDRSERVLAGGDDSGLAALALNPNRLAVEVDRLKLERDQLLRPEP